MRTTPSGVIALIRGAYPEFNDQTNIGSHKDVSHISGIADALDAIPDELIIPSLHTAFVSVKGRLRNAVRTWETRGMGTRYLSGRDLSELLQILKQCPDSLPLVELDPTQSSTLKQPLIFISCGQHTTEEIRLGTAMERLVKETTPYDAYFAEQQNSLEGLSSHILSSLGRCSAFVGVAHHRGIVSRPSDLITRASVWVEQELAIAAFIQHALRRPMEVALYLQRGIYREGIRQQLRLAPIEFETSDEVLTDFRARISTWQLNAPHSVAPAWRWEAVQRTGDRHDYRFTVDLINNGAVRVEDWRVRVEFPQRFVDGVSSVVEEDSERLSAPTARMYPGDRRPSIITVPYYVDRENFDSIDAPDAVAKVFVWSGDMAPLLREIPISKLNEF